MKLVIQRVTNASILINEKEKRNINKGLVVLLGIHKDDKIDDIDYYIKKIINLRIFEKDNKMNLSIKDIDGEILLVSQFTLYANTKNGNRPSFEESMPFKDAKIVYDIFVDKLKKEFKKVKTSEFGSNMKITLTNDGPVTIILN